MKKFIYSGLLGLTFLAVNAQSIQNTFLGTDAGLNSTGNANTYVGLRSGRDTNGGTNTFIGADAGLYTTDGSSNTSIGVRSGGNGYYNVNLGIYAGLGSSGDENIYIGYNTGYATNGSGNVFLGSQAGNNLTTSGTFIVENFYYYQPAPLIKGDFATGKVGVAVNSFPTTAGSVDVSNYKFFVKGGILAEEIRVATTWADYVFENNYKLPTLKEVEQHIADNGHLINVPSAKEVEENGISLGEIAKIQQEKIEELTLYIIEQNKVNEKQAEEIKELKEMFMNFSAKKQ